MNWETEDTPDSLIGADVPADLVAHYFIFIIQPRSIHIGVVNLKHNHIAAIIHILRRTAELNINMSTESFAGFVRVHKHVNGSNCCTY